MTSKEALERLLKIAYVEPGPTKEKFITYARETEHNKTCSELYNAIKQDLDKLEKLEKFKKLCLTKYVPLDCLSPSFWESEKEWLELMSYDYYLYLCEDVCEYVVKDNQKLTPKEFKLIYDLLKEVIQ